MGGRGFSRSRGPTGRERGKIRRLVTGTAIRTKSSPDQYSIFATEALLSYTAESVIGTGFNLNLVNSLILRFVDHKSLNSFLSMKSIFRFARILPITLASGYIYLEKYMSRAKVAFSDCSMFVKFFFVCCLIGSKFIHDVRHPGDPLLTSWDLMANEVNYIEGLILSTINYDVEISSMDVRRLFLRSRMLSDDRKSLNTNFHEAVKHWDR